MQLVNLVGTRAARGEHEALVRWYADHVHMLLAFEGLHGAALYRAAQLDAQTPAPQYLCFYDFASAEAFDAYETSAVRVDAERDRQAGWGRDGIEITMRAAYWRRYRRQGAGEGQRWQVEAWRCEGTPSPEIERALAAHAGSHGGLTLLRARSLPSKVADLLSLSTHPAALQPPPGLMPRWRGAYEALLQWRR